MDKTNRKYTNGEITVFWQPKKCIHATTCYKELIEVFNPRNRPWVNLNGASTEEIIRVVELCPTQALSFKKNNPGTEKPAEVKEVLVTNEVRIMQDGPLIVKGEFIIIDTDGKEQKKLKMASLCRCGKSFQLPFCDGTHRKVGFTAK